MADLKFADTHNLVAFLSKPAESEGFEQIVDFLNANPIRYALTINPTIYNFQILQLEDAEGVDCLPNSTIFEQLTLMGKAKWKRYIRLPQSSGPTEHVVDKAVYKELDDSLVRVATTASSLEAKHDSSNIAKTQSKATPNESSSLGTTSGDGPRRQETIRDFIAQTRFENVSKHSNDPLLARGNTLQSGEDSLKLNELMELCTNLQTRVLDLEKTKTTQAKEIVSLKRRVKKLEQKKRSRTHGLKRLYKVGLTARVESSGDEESLEDADMFNVNTLTGDEVLAEQEVVTKEVNLTVDEVTLAQALAALKSVKPKPKGIVLQEPGESTTTTIISSKVQDKGKEKMIEPEKPLKKKDQISLMNKKLSYYKLNDIQAKVDTDYQLAQKLQAEEQEQFTTEQKVTLFKELLEQRRKHFAAKRAEEKRNKPPTKTEQKKTMITYLKNMEGWKHKDLKSKDFDSIKELFDKAFKRVNMFVDYRTDLVEGSSKRAGDELEQEVTKKQKVDDVQETAKVDDNQEAAKIKELMKIIPDEEEVALDAIPLATKPPTIVD
ncbi:hypothetical protein Tco_0599365 [Tanacetum coccineum]